jgi:hypothetical protein
VREITGDSTPSLVFHDTRYRSQDWGLSDSSDSAISHGLLLEIADSSFWPISCAMPVLKAHLVPAGLMTPEPIVSGDFLQHRIVRVVKLSTGPICRKRAFPSKIHCLSAASLTEDNPHAGAKNSREQKRSSGVRQKPNQAFPGGQFCEAENENRACAMRGGPRSPASYSFLSLEP